MILKSLLAFLVGGGFCLIAQILIDKTALTPAKILVSYVICGVILGALGLYSPIFDICGCGISIPIIGFGASVAKGVSESILKDGIFGVMGGAFIAAAIGCTVSLIMGFLMSLFFKSKSKRQ